LTKHKDSSLIDFIALFIHIKVPSEIKIELMWDFLQSTAKRLKKSTPK